MKWSVLIFCVVLALGSSLLHAQTSNITFLVNTATVPDTVVPTTSVVVTGSEPELTNWGDGFALTNVGGDYWMGTVALHRDTVNYKLRVNGQWEENVAGFLNNSNRNLAVPDHDTTVELQFWNNGHFANGKNPGQYDPPWSPAADTFMNVYFRVNMQGVIDQGAFSFNNNTDTVAVRGGGPAGADLSWNTSFYLSRETTATNGSFTYDATNFWSGRLRFPKNAVNAGDVIQFKYLIGYTWGRDELQGQSNRSFTIPIGKKDTTLQYVYYNNQSPIARVNTDTVIVSFTANLATAIQNRGFSIGDTVTVRTGYFSTGLESGRQKRLVRQAGSIYKAIDTIVTSIGKTLDYQYYLTKNGVDYREIYYNFGYSGSITAEQERRQIDVDGSTLLIRDTAVSISNARRQPNFRNTSLLSQPITVTYTVDVRPAIYQVKYGSTLTDRQGTQNVDNPDSVIAWGVAINGPATGGWGPWGRSLLTDTNHTMYDDGTHGDAVAGDSIYSLVRYYATTDVVGQEFKFGIGGGDNEGGFGNNHIENLDDSQPVSTLASQFGSIDPVFYNQWNYDCGCLVTGVNDKPGLPVTYALNQNYPNPFNPATKIEYAIPSESHVTLVIFNLLGQKVASVVNERQTAGSHVVSFDASKLPSGIYFYRIQAGTFTSTKKMTLMK